MDKVIFVDRDGVINKDLIGDYVTSWDEFRFETGAVEGLKRLQDAGFKVIVISNQAGVGEGVFTEEALWDVHEHMIRELEHEGVQIYATHYCLHKKDEPNCSCRKPKTGLFEKAVEKLEIDKKKTYFIGDKATDVDAGKRFGIKTFFVRTGHGKADESKLSSSLQPDFVANNLLEATKILAPKK